ncbi:sugar phosphate isomerase/epimerase family protein [Ammoniphilus resinae]|uniref:Sugar phosphate isomerase/epimerase n=1 Tax=Ammoniphilus resinae TaxID=861532 RepID=A0ABS4GMQ4_9BACL|nr:sugar phosphate isomerase/epimerase [Ammoniphilus resinae]MBP1931342.1 sugar phosphate isomerase/epimerase [Ammoniphilus resinae]
MKQIPVAVQMYTLRTECSDNFIQTLEQVAALGYNGVEFAGYWGVEPYELRKVIDRLGLRAAGSHIALAQLESNLDEWIEAQQILGSQHIICPSLSPERRGRKEEYQHLAEQLNEMGQKCEEVGITFSYHNHDFDLVPFGETTGLEIILQETNPNWVKAELDVYWLTRSGHDPVAWMQRYAGRTPLIHLKDMTTDDERFFAELGTGGVDLSSIIAQGQELQVEWWVVEQDRTKRSAIQSISISIDYLKQNHSIGIK